VWGVGQPVQPVLLLGQHLDWCNAGDPVDLRADRCAELRAGHFEPGERR
jgi:hypothetical protein